MDRHYSLILAAGLLMLGTALSSADSLSLTSYYPSPQGVYDTLWSQRIGIGTTVFSGWGALNVLNGGNIVLGTTSPSNILGGDQGGKVELGSAFGDANPINGGTPYIDMHYGNGLVQDYNVRFINSADNVFAIQTAAGGRLNLSGQRFSINTADATLGGRVDSAFTIRLAGSNGTGLATTESNGNLSFAINPNPGGSWTMYDYRTGSWTSGITQRAGNVGVGTITPQGKLAVDTTAYGLNLYGNWPDLGFNAKYVGGWRYQNNGYAALIENNQTAGTGGLYFRTAPSGTANTAIPWNIPLYFHPNGNVGVRNANPNHELKVTGSIQATGRLGVASCPSGLCDPNSGYPSGWGGGVHTWDVYAEGIVAVGTGGSVKSYLHRNGEIFSSGQLRINPGTSPTNELIINKEQVYKTNSGAYGDGENNLYLNTWNTNGGLVAMGNYWTYPTSPNDLYVGGAIRSYGYSYGSDARLKKDIRPVTDALKKITQLNGVHFAWKGTTRNDIGLIAQDVEKVFPELVQEDSKGMKSVAYGNVMAVLVETLKEQQKQIKDLEKEIQQLKKERS